MDTPEIPKRLSWQIERECERVIARQIISTQNEMVREALIALGWMPPESRQHLYVVRNLVEDSQLGKVDPLTAIERIDHAIHNALYDPGATTAQNPTVGS